MPSICHLHHDQFLGGALVADSQRRNPARRLSSWLATLYGFDGTCAGGIVYMGRLYGRLALYGSVVWLAQILSSRCFII